MALKLYFLTWMLWVPPGVRLSADDVSDCQKYLSRGVQLQIELLPSLAELAYLEALREAEQQFGSAHFCIAEILDRLATLRTEQHDYSGALAAFERALSIHAKTLGPQSVEGGLVLTNIAMIYQHQRRYAMAEAMYRRAISMLESSAGPAHRYTARSQTGMAILRLAQHRNSEAEDLLERAIPVLKTSDEPDDPTLLIALTNLAEAYRIDGRYSKAEPLYRRSLAILEARPLLRTEEISFGLSHFPLMLRKMKRKAEARVLETQIKTVLPEQ